MKKTYYLFNPGTLERKDNTLRFTPMEEGEEGWTPIAPARYLPVENIGDLYVFGSLQGSSTLFNFLGQSDIAVHFFDYYENYTGSFMPRDSYLSGRMLMAQAAACQNKKQCLLLGRLFIEGAAFNMQKNLRYYNSRGKDLTTHIDTIEDLVRQLPMAEKREVLMGIEGNIRQVYYDAFDTILNDYEMGPRTKRPPKNEVNALISFGNMMCYTITLRAIHQTQLNPTISYLHVPGERRFSLALDVAEIFKPILVDRTIFNVLNKRMLQDHHFEQRLNSVILNPSGKKIFVAAFEERLKQTFKHRSLGRSVSYKHLIKLECYKIQKHLLGIEPYLPFKMYW